MLGYRESIPALERALEENSSSIHDGVQSAETDFAKSLVSRWDEKRRAAGPVLSQKSDVQMLEVLRSLCDAYSRNERRLIEALELTAFDIGKELNRRGGMKEMLRVFNMLQGRPGSRTLEMHWNGIGDWMG